MLQYTTQRSIQVTQSKSICCCNAICHYRTTTINRTTKNNRVGHIRDVRRLVVALSRARLGLYVFCRRSLFEMCLELAPAFNKLLLKTSEQPVGESQLQLVPGEGWPATRPEYPPPPAPYSVQIADVSRMGVLVHQMASAALQCLAAAEQHAQAQAAAAAAATAAAATAGATAAANQATADAAAAATAAAAAAAGDADMDVEQEGGGANGTDETVEELEGEGSFDPDAETDE
eukprot:17863-Heterococcus_DN1.PRE.1